MKLVLKNIYKSIDKLTVLNNLCGEFETGNIYAIVSSDEKANSCLLKILCGLYNCDEGYIEKDNNTSIRGLIGEPSFLNGYSGLDNLKKLSKLGKNISFEEIIESLKLVDLNKYMDINYSEYSSDMRKKLGIAQAIMEKSDIIVLENPFRDLGEGESLIIRETLNKLKKDSIIIISVLPNVDVIGFADVIYELKSGTLTKYEVN